MEHFFSSNSTGDLRSDAHQSQIIGRDADVDHTQIIEGDISPPSSPGFGTPGRNSNFRILTCLGRCDVGRKTSRPKNEKDLHPFND